MHILTKTKDHRKVLEVLLQDTLTAVVLDRDLHAELIHIDQETLTGIARIPAQAMMTIRIVVDQTYENMTKIVILTGRDPQ